MIKRHGHLFILCCLCGSFLYGQEDAPQQGEPLSPPPPQVVEQQLESAEREFDEAKKMFNPWYAGPLLTPSAHILPPGQFLIQPYVFFTTDYGKFDQHGKSHHIPHIHTLKVFNAFQVGIIDWMDGVIGLQAVRNTQKGHCASGFGDMSVSLGFELLNEAPYIPALLFGVQETFPTGRYQHLNPKKGGIDAIGAGSYQTTLSLNTSKVFWWFSLHPMAMRLSLSYDIFSDVHVKGFNAYGGGKGTDGTVNPGNNFSLDYGYEFSFTQRWVFALDFVYSYTSRTTFKGRRGMDAAGGHNVVGGPFSDQISLAPALEYNPSPNLNFLAGAWFSVWGRNSLNFVSAVLSLVYAF
jgi:hypothetical protein